MNTLNIPLLCRIGKIFLNYHHLLLELASWFTLRGSNCPYLEQILMIPSMFKPFRFDFSCIFWRFQGGSFAAALFVLCMSAIAALRCLQQPFRFLLLLFILFIFFFWCLGKVWLRNCGISYVTSFHILLHRDLILNSDEAQTLNMRSVRVEASTSLV